MHHPEGHRDGRARGGLDGGGARGFLRVAALRQGERGHDTIESRGVLVHERKKLVFDPLALLRPRGEFFPARVPPGLVGREVGHHRAQRGAERAHVGGNGTTPGRRTLAGGLVGKRPQIQPPQFSPARIPQEVLDDALLGLERGEFVEPERADGDLDQFLFGNSDGTLLLAQKMAARVEQRRQRNQADQLGARHAQAALVGRTARLVERRMHRRHGNIGEINGDLRDPVFGNEPTDGLHAFQRAGKVDRLALGVFHRIARRVFLRPAGLADVEGDGVGATC